MSERKARIMKEMAEELYQNARSIDALSGNMELREETIRHNNAHIVRLRGSVDQCHTRLADKDAEIAWLTTELQHKSGEDVYLMEILQSTGITLNALTVNGKLKTVISTLQATIKEREAEANSYRELYNELRGKVLKQANVSNPNEATHKMVLQELQCIINEVGIYKKSAMNNVSNALQNGLKYDRLVALLKRCESSDCYTDLILAEHRENEKKLAKRKGKVTTDA